MTILELFIVALGLSVDAVTVAACLGLTMRKPTIKKSVIVGLYFGFFQALMPLIGYLLASLFADKITAFDHWIAFGLLAFIGGKMIVGSFKRQGCADRECPETTCPDRQCPGGKKPEYVEPSLSPAKMLPPAIATSIDALAVGITFAFLQVNIASAVAIIGTITFALSFVAVKIGGLLGKSFKSKSELVGGAMLILMGVKILLEHLGVISF